MVHGDHVNSWWGVELLIHLLKHIKYYFLCKIHVSTDAANMGEVTQQGLINQGAHPPLPLLLLPPYKGSRAMLQINGTWITAHHKGKLYKARQTKPVEEYLKRKYNWSNRTLNDIHWPSIKTTRQKLSRTKQMQTCKIMHEWLPLAHM